MTARTGAGLLAALAAPLLVLASASWLALLPGLWLLGVAAWLWRRPEPAAAGWAVMGGALAFALGAGFVAFGLVAAGLLTVALGLAAGFVGAQLSLARHPRTRPLPAPRSPRTSVAAAADEAMKWYWHVSGLLSPPPEPGAWLAGLRAAAERNRAAGVLEDPARAHLAPPALEKHALRRAELAGLPPAEEISFASEFEPRDPEVRERYLALAPNRTARALLWRHRGGARPTVILIHGYGMGRAPLDARAFDVPRLHRLGLDVALVTLPLHGPRAAGRRSGAGFLDDHPLFTNAAFEQSIFELRRLCGWLRGQGSPRVGVYGMSLGGYTAALFASLERGLACAVPLVPAVCLPTILAAGRSPDAQRLRDSLGVTDALLAEAWASHDPLRHRPRVAPEGRLILAGLSDRICTPDQVEALWRHWDEPAIHWFEGSHLAPFGRRARQERLEVHLRSTLLAPEEPRLSRFQGLV